ncbi:sulfite exporter TauE/SafE family protein [Marinigracilibium pacificum]|uniref:Probable membrane transporter protein n=1 Tax=Marinigracilibium pacificum TaxID=2729599 RepID=A0A848J130_9BACT|nr:sulfite exporter TauE/SafE family protein [Marinigracilibium pacificum]NMM50267.1 sulfite exporter TauE/SafE family protein [Marinigracilibium pacificum]
MFRDLNLIFLLLALIAEVIGTVGGFGSSVFFVPIANFYFDFYTVLGLTAVFHLSSNLSKIALFRKGLDKELLLYLGLPSVLFVIIGGVLSDKLDSKILEILLSVFLISLSLLFLIKKNLKVEPTKNSSIIGGGLSGFVAGLLGTGGAIRGITMNAFNLKKEVFIATSAMIDMMIDSTRTVVYYNNGYITKDIFIYIPFLFVIGYLGTHIGKYVLKYIPQERFKSISLILILVIGLVTGIKFII